MAALEELQHNNSTHEMGCIVQNSNKTFNQLNLFNMSVPKIRLGFLSDRNMHILKEIAFARYPISAIELWKGFKMKIGLNTIKRLITELESYGMIKQIFHDIPRNDGERNRHIANTISDRRYKKYAITAIGMEEFNNQLGIRSRPIKSIKELTK